MKLHAPIRCYPQYGTFILLTGILLARSDAVKVQLQLMAMLVSFTHGAARLSATATFRLP
jgi:hypothetical protein